MMFPRWKFSAFSPILTNSGFSQLCCSFLGQLLTDSAVKTNEQAVKINPTLSVRIDLNSLEFQAKKAQSCTEMSYIVTKQLGQKNSTLQRCTEAT